MIMQLRVSGVLVLGVLIATGRPVTTRAVRIRKNIYMHKVTIFIVAVFVYTSIVSSANAYENRLWTSKSGATIEASFFRVTSGGIVILKKHDGEMIRISRSGLSADDNAFIDSLLRPKANPSASLFDYSTSFEQSEGYVIGNIDRQKNWAFLNPSELTTATVESGFSHEGKQALILSNAHLVKEYTFRLRRDITPYAVKGTKISSTLFWAPLTGDASSEAGWKITDKEEKEYYSISGGLFLNRSDSIDFKSRRHSIGHGKVGPDPTLKQWNKLLSLVVPGKSLPTGENITTYDVTLSNAGGECTQTNMVITDINFTAKWLDIDIVVKPQSSVALDSMSFIANSP